MIMPQNYTQQPPKKLLIEIDACNFYRCGSRRARRAVHPETAPVLRTFRLCRGPAVRPEMEGGKARRLSRDAGVHFAEQQQGSYHRSHLPGNSQYGRYHRSRYKRTRIYDLLVTEGSRLHDCIITDLLVASVQVFI